jgi:hypothetical protein
MKFTPFDRRDEVLEQYQEAKEGGEYYIDVAFMDRHGTVLGTVRMYPKDFSSGSVGWYAQVQSLLVGGSLVECGGQVQLIVKGSKP